MIVNKLLFVPLGLWFAGNFVAATVFGNSPLPYWANFTEGTTAFAAVGLAAWGVWRNR